MTRTAIPVERIDMPLPVGQPPAACEICGAPATIRLYRDGAPRAFWSCDDCLEIADAQLGGATTIRHLRYKNRA
jgi:hypothetical protein